MDSYKKVETAVGGGYQKIEDAFVNQFLTREGESVADAKERLKKSTSEVGKQLIMKKESVKGYEEK